MIRKLLARREILVAIGFAVVSAIAHLLWRPIVAYWQLVAVTVVVVAGLTFWLVNEWRRLQSFITKFYCLAVIFDTFAEGLLQPFHRCTANNLMCTGRMFLVFFSFWLVAHPLERWLTTRKIRGLTAPEPPTVKA